MEKFYLVSSRVSSDDQFQHSPRAVAQISTECIFVVARKLSHHLLEVQT